MSLILTRALISHPELWRGRRPSEGARPWVTLAKSGRPTGAECHWIEPARSLIRPRRVVTRLGMTISSPKTPKPSTLAVPGLSAIIGPCRSERYKPDISIISCQTGPETAHGQAREGRENAGGRR